MEDIFISFSAHKVVVIVSQTSIIFSSNQTSGTELLPFDTSLTSFSTSFLHETRQTDALSPFNATKKRPSSSQGFAQSSQFKCSKIIKRSSSSLKIEDNLNNFNYTNSSKDETSLKSKGVKVEEPVDSLNFNTNFKSLCDKSVVDNKEKTGSKPGSDLKNESKNDTFKFASLNNKSNTDSTKSSDNLKLNSLDKSISGTLIFNLV